jgi:hypothetical protein
MFLRTKLREAITFPRDCPFNRRLHRTPIIRMDLTERSLQRFLGVCSGARPNTGAIVSDQVNRCVANSTSQTPIAAASAKDMCVSLSRKACSRFRTTLHIAH